ncbi:MAG TPA: DUF72 domain-containing protein [Ohtaekwangia sp.]|nr:DUF72 domain-containing protein [Ohtaekwangia sp.]
MKKHWWIGCSGFYYRGWREKFYPKGLPQRKWFEYYCEFFNTVELNATFYRFPKLESLQAWYQRSPVNFRFTVKAPQYITHYKRFNNVEQDVKAFYDRVSLGLDDKLGTILFQLHPQMEFSKENLEKITAWLDNAFSNVVEFRHPSWWNDAVFKTLRKKKITFCSISYPGLPDAVIKTKNTMYYRFHGVPKRYLSSYRKPALQHVFESIDSLSGVKDVYAYFNNDINVAAVSNAKILQKLAGTAISG